jgi:hypothetical protein
MNESIRSQAKKRGKKREAMIDDGEFHYLDLELYTSYILLYLYREQQFRVSESSQSVESSQSS